ncbi:MAG: hydrogenase maturation nickel metallochaperone HypA [Bacteroidetes bacterium]|nr:hydrogenase maturation nickel metallochaperone HypA [Bacteroidota bacterium]
MHELSIAESIVDIIRQYFEEKELPRVYDVSVKIGALAGVVPDSLEFSFAAITADTPLPNSDCGLCLCRLLFIATNAA